MHSRYGFSLYDHKLVFPPPSDININMMPIKIFDVESIPLNCRGYLPYIQSCRIVPRHPEWRDKVVYLTIHESWVPVGESQRRSGLHVERPGCVNCGRISERSEPYYGSKHRELCWGLGFYDKIPVDGIYMATNLEDTSRVYPALIKSPHEVSDEHGGIEHLRDIVGEGQNVPAGTLCWITDCTPHESLPVKAPTDRPDVKHVYRQFFRLVVGQISVWYSRHNTPNPLGVQPSAPISDADKFQSK